MVEGKVNFVCSGKHGLISWLVNFENVYIELRDAGNNKDRDKNQKHRNAGNPGNKLIHQIKTDK